jgi:enamine deaminase RidA (YjgF/YER057c/UK114 family)
MKEILMPKSAKTKTRLKKPTLRKTKATAASPSKIGYGSEPGFPISMAMRAGDFVFTSAQGDHGFNPADVVYDKDGLVVSDGHALPPRSMADETRATLRCIEATLKEAGCTLDDVVDASVWLRDPRDFHEMNKAYAEFFTQTQPTRSIFRIDFMFDCRIEIKVTAYKPLGSTKPSRLRRRR